MPVCQVAEEYVEQSLAGQLGPDDEERVLLSLECGEGEVQARHQVPERHGGCLPDLPARGETEVADAVEVVGL